MHPTPVQIAYGSATVISSTLLLLVLAPTGSGLAVALIAAVALMLGVVVAIGVRSRREARADGPAADGPAHSGSRGYETAPARLPEVRV